MPAKLKLRKMPTGPSVPKTQANKSGRPKTNHPDRQEQFRWMFSKLASTWAQPQAEYQFHESRKWRFDFAWPDLKIAVEIQGGIFQRKGTGHRSISGMKRDQEKMNAAQMDGWCVLQFNARDLDDRTTQVVIECQKALSEAARRSGKVIPCTGK